MLKELVEKATKLQQNGKLPPAGYTVYSNPIKWIIHIDPSKDSLHIEEYQGENRPRAASSNRTGNNTSIAYPFADESGYVSGNSLIKGGGKDKKSDQKHLTYLQLLNNMAQSQHFNNPLLQEAIREIITKLEDGSISKALSEKGVYNKDWITFVYRKGELLDKYLHEISQTKAFWAETAYSSICSEEKYPCCICGNDSKIVKNMPIKLNLKGSRRQLASFNRNSFVSFRFTKDDALLGICPICAENSAQALNYLLENSSYTIYEDKTSSGEIKNDSIRNQVAVFWLKEETDITLEAKQYNIMDILQAPLNIKSELKVDTTKALVRNLLASPWTGQISSLSINENTFYLCILSPNTGRVIIRDWIQVAAGRVKENLHCYFNALSLFDPFGKESRPFTIQQLLEPLKDTDTNMTRALIRSAYLGEKPPLSLFQSAIRRLRIAGSSKEGYKVKRKQVTNETENKSIKLSEYEIWHRICALIKFYLVFGKEELENMEYESIKRNTTAYQCGRLLAVLEQIQKRAATSRLSTTIVERYYGSASTSPLTVLPILLNMATKAHMPKIRKNNRGYTELEKLLEEITTRIDETGGFPGTLLLKDQGEFALGFYCQRAKFYTDKVDNSNNTKEVNNNDAL